MVYFNGNVCVGLLQMNMNNVKQAIKEKSGYAFMVIEEMFWIDVLSASLELTKGNASKAADKLGISRITFASRCKKHGVDPLKFSQLEPAKRIDEETKAYWRKKITSAMSNTSNISQAARELNWNRTTLQSRMKIVGLR